MTTTIEITTNSSDSTVNVTTNNEATMNVNKSRLESLLENVDTSAVVRKQLDAAQKKLVELENTIIVLTEQLAQKANEDEVLRTKVLDMVSSLRNLGLSDDVIAVAVSKQFNLSLPSPNKAANEPSDKAPNKPNSEAMAKRLGINEEANDQILAFVRANKEGVGMKAIIENFPEYAGSESQRFAGYVRSLVETGRLITTGSKKGTKYFAR